jgi:hypothetical protein
MGRTKQLSLAREMARERGMLYGFCVFDGWLYVGSEEQLKAIGCVDIQSA